MSSSNNEYNYEPDVVEIQRAVGVFLDTVECDSILVATKLNDMGIYK